MALKNNLIIERKNFASLINDIAKEQIIYVCAPAGYGKTVAVRQWLNQNKYDRIYVSLDEFDNDISHFCGSFCAALRTFQPNNAVLRKITKHPSFDSAPEEFTFRAIASLSENNRVCLVIDDLHFLHSERVQRLLLGILKRVPDSFQIVLISRNKLPLGFSDLWLKGNLVQITADDLRFSRDEIKLLYKLNGCSITYEKANEIRRFTDGWAIGIGAMVLSDGVPHGDGDYLKYLDEFIRANVWQHWNDSIRDFMLKTSVVTELTPALCDVLTDSKNGKDVLEQLVKQNVFISKAESGVYKYHRLFYDFLQKMAEQRGKKFYCDLVEKVGWWYLDRKDFYNAVDCFIRCESQKGIIKCFVFLAVIDRHNFIVDKLLPILNLPVIHETSEKFPLIYSMLSWCAFSEGRVEDMMNYADNYYKKQLSVLKHDPRLAFYIIYMRLVDFRVSLYELIQMISKIPKILILINAPGAIPSIGIINQYMPLLHRGTRDFSECAVGDIESNVKELEKVLGNFFGDEANLLAECLMAGLLYEQGHLDKACSHALAANSKTKKHFAAETKFCAMSVLVYVLDALEQYEQANQTVKNISDMIEQERAYFLNYNLNALTVRRRIGKGDIKTACNWIAECEPLREDLDFYRIYGHITTCRAYISKGDYDNAIITLKKLLALAKAYNRPLDVIEAQILMSIAYWKKKRGFQGEAMKYLEQAASTAYIYGYTQLFVNEGAELSGMLRRLQKSIEQRPENVEITASFIKMLYLNTLENQKDGLTSGQPAPTEQYTEKQLTVMRLLCEGKSYREIAISMGVKLPTLRSHISLIYKKLDVTRETDAVVKIKTLGIFGDRF